ncbi:MAG TPA: hypothetical protein PK325_01105 [Cyclobacteriaceae bacterium]|nr:hypothetical protein [Cyclobacteriaceae bacterium]HMV08132.1 hypothetical protein [Cyclobacteriaceae bacterium]HMV88346.1 hypothetical protein [Cyclobacteriaceae bacterium]HMX00773.1 hypothetical protein [Cyclobacteriaceae bacterium]HMX49352.1 hypothetical protein [Cyclobacteriaceae bacterium]
MIQLNNLADSRLIRGCIYCGGPADTRDHVPSKCLLEKPYPENLPVVGCCVSCNQDFSKDEQYLVCIIESVLCGSTDPEKIGRPSVAKIMQNSPALRQRIENSKTEVDGKIAFVPEMERICNVMLKLARGHAAFELSQPCDAEPDHFWCGPLSSLPQEAQDEFHSVHFQQTLGEVGSRNMQRLMVTQMAVKTEEGGQKNIEVLFNDWIDVQDDQYRYIAIDDMGTMVIRIVIAEYFACEVAWGT